jgi:hypothetical protein
MAETGQDVYHQCLPTGQGRMGYAQTFEQQRYRCFLQWVAVGALIFLLTSAVAAQAPASGQSALPWQQDLQNDPGLLRELGQLLEKLQHDVQLPPARNQSHLLPLLPESTTIYAAIPNYGDASHQALAIFQRQLRQSPALRSWWQHGELAENGPRIEDFLEKAYQLSQYLGDEIVVSGATEAHPGPSLLILAEVRKPGLKDFLQQLAKEHVGKSTPTVRVLDVQELTAAKDKEAHPPQQLVILVRPDFVVGALDVAALRSFNARLDRGSRDFASVPFGQRLARAYEDGTSVVAGADLHKILSQIPPGPEPSQETFRRTGFAETKYLVWEHKSVAGQATSQMELSFTGPRRGVASWLAAPGPMRSLDFVSPKAVLVGSVLLKNPAQIFDEVKDLSSTSNPKAFETIAQMEDALKLSLKDDLLGRLGGEVTFEIDRLAPPDPVWKAILQLNDPDRLQATLSRLLARIPINAQQSEEGGITYRTLRIPSAQKTLEIGYAFVDGYLVIGSSRATVADAVQRHQTGQSLAKSSLLVASSYRRCLHCSTRTRSRWQRSPWGGYCPG